MLLGTIVKLNLREFLCLINGTLIRTVKNVQWKFQLASNFANNQTDEESDNCKERCDKESSFTTLRCANDESDQTSQNQATMYEIINGDNYNSTPGRSAVKSRKKLVLQF